MDFKLKIMRKKIVFWFLLFVYCSYAQDYIKNETINILSKNYEVTHISYGNSSLTKFYKIFTCDSKYKEQFVKQIINCAKKNKLEYSEFYIIFIPKLNSLSNYTEKKIATFYLEKLDNERMKLNLSTGLIKFNYDYKNNSYKYLLNEPREKINNLKFVFYKISLSNVCNCMKK
jgi:hypothetical protein